MLYTEGGNNEKSPIYCDSILNTGYILVWIPFVLSLVLIIVMIITLNLDSETRLSILGATALIITFLNPYLIYKRISHIKKYCGECTTELLDNKKDNE